VEEAKADAKAFLCKLPSSFVPRVGTSHPRAESSFPSVLSGSSARAILLEPTPQGSQPFTARDSNPGNLATTTANYYRPSQLVRAIRALVSLAPCRVHPPSIDFSVSPAVAIHNRGLLREKGNDLRRLVTEQPFSVMTMGLEFCPVEQIKTLLSGHPLWVRWEEGLTEGVTYPMAPYDAGKCTSTLRSSFVAATTRALWSASRSSTN
jgi:hypothetical protein